VRLSKLFVWLRTRVINTTATVPLASMAEEGGKPTSESRACCTPPLQATNCGSSLVGTPSVELSGLVAHWHTHTRPNTPPPTHPPTDSRSRALNRNRALHRPSADNDRISWTNSFYATSHPEFQCNCKLTTGLVD
jgi:hypothetical protein